MFICDELTKCPGIIISFAACMIDLTNHQAVYSNAGHIPLVLLRNNQVIKFENTGSGIGFIRNLSYKMQVFKLFHNDKIILYTDGLSEIESKTSITSAFKPEQIFLSFVNKKNFNDSIIEDIKTRCKDNKFKDDVTLISIDII